MTNCLKCGNEISESSNFCSSCGSKIEKQGQLDESPPSFVDIAKHQDTKKSEKTTEREKVEIKNFGVHPKNMVTKI